MRLPGRLGRSVGMILAAVCAVTVLAGAPPIAAQVSGSSDPTQRLFAAVERNDLPETQASIALGADVFARNPRGQTPTELAVDKGYFDIAHYLLSVRNVMRAIALAPQSPVTSSSGSLPAETPKVPPSVAETPTPPSALVMPPIPEAPPAAPTELASAPPPAPEATPPRVAAPVIAAPNRPARTASDAPGETTTQASTEPASPSAIEPVVPEPPLRAQRRSSHAKHRPRGQQSGASRRAIHPSRSRIIRRYPTGRTGFGPPGRPSIANRGGFQHAGNVRGWPPRYASSGRIWRRERPPSPHTCRGRA